MVVPKTPVHTSGFTIYPNPVNNLLTIKVNDASDLITTLEVYNSVGKLITVMKCCANFVQIDVNPFAEGLYNIRVTYNNKTESKTVSVIK